MNIFEAIDHLRQNLNPSDARVDGICNELLTAKSNWITPCAIQMVASKKFLQSLEFAIAWAVINETRARRGLDLFDSPYQKRQEAQQNTNPVCSATF